MRFTTRFATDSIWCSVRFLATTVLIPTLFVVAMALLCLGVAQAQVTDVTNSTSTPIPGAGHDYIKLLNESVNPANGSVSLRIQVPTPPGRRMSLPFAFAYDSNSAKHLSSSLNAVGAIAWLDNAQYLGKGGWSYSIPTVTGLRITEPVDVAHHGQCVYTSNFVFEDETGGRHSLYLAVDDTPTTCPYGTPVIPIQQLTGGDPYYSAALNQPPGLVYVAGADGTMYSLGFPDIGMGHQGADGSSYSALVTSIEDRNGNIIKVNDLNLYPNSQPAGAFNAIDTLGRTILSSSGFGTTGDTISVAGLPNSYTVTWGALTGGNVVPGSSLIQSDSAGCSSVPAITSAGTVIQRITLPNGTYYSFSYDPNYGLLNRITYPNGGYVSYTYTLNPLSEFASFPDAAGNSDGCWWHYDNPAVKTRTVSFDGVNVAQTQVFSYTPATVWSDSHDWSTKTTSVQTTDYLSGVTSTTQYTYVPYFAPHQPNDGTKYAPQIPVESSVVTKDGSGTTLRTVAKTWYNEYELASETVTLKNNKTSKTTYTYGPGAQITERDDFDYGSGVPARKVVTTYQAFGDTPIFSFGPSIFDRPCKEVTYDGNGNSVAETDFLYDGLATLCATGTAAAVQSVTGLPSGTHDETYYAGSMTPPRGNVTKKTQWSNVGPSSVTTYTYDETGQLLSTTDPCGNASCSDVSGSNHTTTFSYADSYTLLSGTQNVPYSPSSNTNAYLTAITDALGHTSKFTYDYSTGQLTASRDQNDINAGRAGTTYLYNDPLARPKLVTDSDGGTTSHSYNDSLFNATANTPNVTTSKTITSGVSEQTIVATDGLGHVVRTILNSDPEGADITDTTYNGLGQVWKVSNPYRSTSNGTTVNTYDALGRTISVTKPDNSVAGTTYDQTSANTNGTCSTSTDEALNKRFSCTDALGRLIEVDEPGAASAGTATPATGSFSVSGAEQNVIVGPPIAGTGSVTVLGSEQSWQTQTAPATSSSGSVSISGSLQSKQVQTQWASSGTGGFSVQGGPDDSKTIDPCYPYGSCPQTIYNGGSISITVNGYTSSASYDQNSTLQSLASALASGFNNSSSPVNASAGGGAVSVTAKATGASTNYSFSTSATWMSGTCPDGNPCFYSSSFYISPGSGALGGGKDNAYTTVYDHGTTTITISGQPVSYSWSGSGTTPSSIAQGLASAVTSSSSYATASASGSTVYLTSRSTGASVNYSLSSSSSWDTSNFGSPSFGTGNSGGSMTGGADPQYTTNWDSGTVSVTVNGHATSYNWSGSGTTSSTIASGLAQAVNQDGSAVVNASASGTTVNLTSRTAGPSSNYSLSTSTTSQRSSFSSSASGGALTGGSNGTPHYDTGTASVTVGSFTATASYASGSTSSSVASALAAAFSGSGITATASGTTVSLTTSQTGSAANLPLSATSATSQPGTFSPSFSVSPAGASLTGGTDAGSLSLTTAAITLYGYDVLNNVVCVVQNTGGAFTPTYSNCTSASANWRPRWFQYDSLSRLVNAHNPENGNMGYSYDVNGNLTSKTDARSITTHYFYDSLNRLTQETYTDGTASASYGYDGVAGPANCPPALSASNPIGKRTSMCDAAGTESWSYPLNVGAGWQIVDQRTTNGVTKTTTTQSNLDASLGTVTYPSGRVVSYSYSGAGRPLSVVDSTNGINYVTNATYAPFGGLSGMKNGSSITVTNSYDSRLQPNVLSASGAAGVILSMVYDFHLGNGDNGNLYQITNGKDPNRTQNFTYDALNRIAEAWSSGPQWGERFTTDGWSNLAHRDQIPGKTAYEPLSASINANNQMIGFGYDAAGNMTSNGGANYTYDAESRLKTAGGLTYTYDGDGNRVIKSGSTIYWGAGPLAESDLSGNLQHEYIFFGGKRVARLDLATGSPNYYFENHIGSTSVMTDSSGNPEEDLDYYPYGGIAYGTASDKYLFTGKERDAESSLDYFGARHYASSMGRFMTADQAADETIPVPLPFADFRNPQTLNLYSYALNNPVSNVDPDGHDVHVCVDNSSGGQNCFNMSDKDYANLQQQQNGQNGVNMPGGSTPNGNITCGGQVCGSATFFEPGLRDSSVDLALFVTGVASIGESLIKGGLGLLRSAGEAGAGTAAREAGAALAEQTVVSGGKAAIRDALENGAVNELQKQAVKRALARGAAGDSFTLTRLADGSVKISTEVAGRAGGRAVYEKVIDAAGQTTSVVQRAYDASGALTHVDPKFP